jgi:hypothetical protein
MRITNKVMMMTRCMMMNSSKYTRCVNNIHRRCYHHSSPIFQQQQQQKEDENLKQVEQIFKKLKEMNAQLPFTFGTAAHPRDFLPAIGSALHLPMYRMFFDRSFDEKEFLEGCKIAFLATRKWLVQGDLTSLEQVMTPDAYQLLKEWYNRVNVQTTVATTTTTDNVETETETTTTTTTTDNAEETKRKKLIGHVEEIKHCQIKKIFINFVNERLTRNRTEIIVIFEVKEYLDLVDIDYESDESSEKVTTRLALYKFVKGENKDDPWQIGAFLA